MPQTLSILSCIILVMISLYPLFPALRRQRQTDFCEFEARLVHKKECREPRLERKKRKEEEGGREEKKRKKKRKRRNTKEKRKKNPERTWVIG